MKKILRKVIQVVLSILPVVMPYLPTISTETSSDEVSVTLRWVALAALSVTFTWKFKSQ